MLFLDNRGITDPRINLAIEEYALKHLDIDESYLLFYINQPSIIIGKNQNTIEEINITSQKIQLICTLLSNIIININLIIQQETQTTAD